jgi:hypothetical protein
MSRLLQVHRQFHPRSGVDKTGKSA